MRRLEPHPLFAYLDPQGDVGVARLNVDGMERREVSLEGLYDGEYRAFVIATGLAGGAGHRYEHDCDALWAVGCLTYNWFMWNGVPVDAAHLTRALVEIHDIDRDEPLRTWFRVGYAEGRIESKPLTNYTATGNPPRLTHYLQSRDDGDVRGDAGDGSAPATSIRLAAILIPENRCPAPG